MDFIIHCVVATGICGPLQPAPPQPEQHYVIGECKEAFNGVPRNCYLWPVPRDVER